MKKETKIAISIIRQANEKLFKLFHRQAARKKSFKKHGEIVTPADLQINRLIIKELLHHFPTYDIVSEESEKIDNLGIETWYLDPLDGTNNFAFGFPEFSICLGLEKKGEILSGAVGIPMSKEIYYAEKNKGAWLGKKKIAVSGAEQLERALVLVCRGHNPEGRKRFNKIINNISSSKIGHIRQFASAGVELAAVASGKADACVLSDIHPWDVIAGTLLVREAGGKVTDIQGREWKKGMPSFVATNGRLHNKVLKIING